jgi:hypothetical protein
MTIIKNYQGFVRSLNESASDDLRSELTDLGYSEKSKEISSGGEITGDIEKIVEVVLAEFKRTSPTSKVTVTSGNDKFHQQLGYSSRHTKGQAIDLVVTPDSGEVRKAFVEILNRVSAGTPGFSYIDEYTNPSSAATAGHFHLSYGPKPENPSTANLNAPDPIKVSGLTGAEVDPAEVNGVIIDSDLITRLIDELKKKKFSQADLAKFSKMAKPNGQPSINLDSKDFAGIVSQVIDKLEGGYYHPDMLRDGRVTDSRYGNSGETLFGIDRAAGGEINDTPEGIEFWNLIDSANARTDWSWGYRGGQLEPKLKNLAGKMIKRYYDKYSKIYLSDEALKIVNENPKLLFNFVYAVWNGPGWFKKFATTMDSAVAKGITDPEELAKLEVQDRLTSGNSLISQGGKTVGNILGVQTA